MCGSEVYHRLASCAVCDLWCARCSSRCGLTRLYQAAKTQHAAQFLSNASLVSPYLLLASSPLLRAPLDPLRVSRGSYEARVVDGLISVLGSRSHVVSHPSPSLFVAASLFCRLLFALCMFHGSLSNSVVIIMISLAVHLFRSVVGASRVTCVALPPLRSYGQSMYACPCEYI